MQIASARSILVAAGSIAVAAVFFAISGLAGDENALARVVLAVSLAMMLNLLYSAITSKTESIFSLVFALYGIVALTLPAMLQCARGYFPFYQKDYDPDDVTATAVLVLVFYVAFQISYNLTLRKPGRADRVPDVPVARPYLAPLRSIPAIVFMWAVAGASMIKVGVHELLARRGDLNTMFSMITPLKAVILYSGRFSGLLSFVLSVALLVKYPSKVVVLLPFLLISSAVFLITNFPLNIPRTLIFAYIVGMMFAFMNTNSPAFKTIFSIGYFVAVAALAPIIHIITREARGVAIGDPLTEYSMLPDLDSFQSIINVRLWINDWGIQWGKQFLSAVFIFVPRSLWHAKAYPTGTEAAHYVGYDYTNVSSPFPSELYSDFGWVGVVVAGVICGIWITHLDRAADRARRCGGRMELVLLGLSAGFVGILMRGSLMGVGPWVSDCVVMAFLLMKFVEKPPGVAPQPQPLQAPKFLQRRGRIQWDREDLRGGLARPWTDAAPGAGPQRSPE